MEPILRARYEVGLDDHVALQMRMLRESPLLDATYRKNWRNGIVAGLVVSGGLALLPFVMLSDPRRATMQAAITAVLFWGVIFPLYVRRHLTRKAFDRNLRGFAKKNAQQHQRPGKVDLAEVLIFPDQLAVLEDDGQVGRPWETVSRALEGQDALYVYGSSGWVLRMPNRAFASDADRQAFCRTINDLAAGEPDPVAARSS
jgi:hypothetical protein